jgi:hypothetical protein
MAWSVTVPPHASVDLSWEAGGIEIGGRIESLDDGHLSAVLALIDMEGDRLTRCGIS